MTSPKLVTRFIELNILDDDEGGICVMTTFIPIDIDLYRSQTTTSLPMFSNQLDKFDSISELKEFAVLEVELDKIVNRIKGFSEDRFEIINVCFVRPMMKVIQQKLDKAKINYIWHEKEDINNIEFKKIHWECTKIRIDHIKLESKRQINGLMEEFN
jgi:hypothetical protein